MAPEATVRQEAARKRAAEDLVRRLKEAERRMAEVEKSHRPRSKKGRSKQPKHETASVEGAAEAGGPSTPTPIVGEDGAAPAEAMTPEVQPAEESVAAPLIAGGDPKVPSPSEADDKKSAPRVSITDPEARVMKMGDGGFRPAFNGQFATDVKSQIIVGVDITDIGSDKSQMEPMVKSIEQAYGQLPGQFLVDNGFVKLEAVERIEAKGVEVIAPVQQPRDPARDPHQRLESDGPGVGAWRERMGTDEAKQAYKLRAATAECVNALARNRALKQFNVRGMAKAKAVMLWHALAHNLRRALTLAPEAALGMAT